jgi:hypothetical protein
LAIYNPELFLADTDRELLRLIGDLILSWNDQPHSNAAGEQVPLSNAEAVRLLELLDQFVTSKKFVEGSYLIEKLFGAESLYDSELRDIYLSWRHRVGKSRAVAKIQWENLLGRVGIWTTSRGNPDVWYRASARPMPFDHFVRMEAKLAHAAQVHPRVKALILRLVNARSSFIEEVRFGRDKLPAHTISDPPKELLEALRRDSSSPVGPPPMKTSKLVGIMTIVMDFSALYTTRDWSVTAFLSTVAGAVPPVVLD